MKKYLRFSIITIVIFLMGYLSSRIISKIRLRCKVSKSIVTLPQFSFSTLSHNTFTKKDIGDTLGRVIFELFSPDCEHCQYMANVFVKNRHRLHGTKIIMVTPFGDSASVALFSKTYGLDSLANIHVLLDTADEFYKIFAASLVPSFYVYKNNRLIKSIKGETRLDNLFD